jgi:hypothetical protein
MSRMSDLQISIAEQINAGAFFEDIVEFLVTKYGFDYDTAEDMVYTVEAEVTMDNEQEYYDDSMDGDHESALASAGWGTDEDYGYFDDYNYDYE